MLALVVQGLLSKEIAAQLYISTRTVDKHIERLLAKTGASRRASAQVSYVHGRRPILPLPLS